MWNQRETEINLIIRTFSRSLSSGIFVHKAVGFLVHAHSLVSTQTADTVKCRAIELLGVLITLDKVCVQSGADDF